MSESPGVVSAWSWGPELERVAYRMVWDQAGLGPGPFRPLALPAVSGAPLKDC